MEGWGGKIEVGVRGEENQTYDSFQTSSQIQLILETFSDSRGIDLFAHMMALAV